MTKDKVSNELSNVLAILEPSTEQYKAVQVALKIVNDSGCYIVSRAVNQLWVMDRGLHD